MNVGSSFLKDRPANEEEIQDLSSSIPYITGPGEYKDIFSVDACQVKGVPDLDEFYQSMERWTFRLN